MTGKDILEGDWQDYDDRKSRDNQDKLKFSCNESWEVNFLVNKIRLAHPQFSEMEIRRAVSECCNIVLVGWRDELVNCVMRRLQSGS